MIFKYYNFSSLPISKEQLRDYMERMDRANGNSRDQNVSRAAIVDLESNLWMDRTLRFKIDNAVPQQTKTLIQRAMRHWQENTCLKFIQASTHTQDYVKFVNRYNGCFSTHVGREGGIQYINLPFDCNHLGIVIHEIGHALGFWHEQSRPDRDRYVRVNLNNTSPLNWFNFLKMRDSVVDHQGSHYDYGSIMHYHLNSFSKPGCTGSDCITLSISNTSEYVRQGSPLVGWWQNLSDQDILQTNRFYSCPCRSRNEGIYGNLTIFLRHGSNLFNPHNTDPSVFPTAYVTVTAVDCNGHKTVRNSQTIQNKVNPRWDEWLVMGVRTWQFFRIRVWDQQITPSSQSLTMSQTFTVSSTPKMREKNCHNSDCTNFVVFDHEVVPSANFRKGSSILHKRTYVTCLLLNLLDTLVLH